MPVTSAISPFVVRLKGGLVLDKSTFEYDPGEAKTLQNFEPSIKGGYRRLGGTRKNTSNEISGSGNILGITTIGSTIIAARGASLFKASATSTSASWTTITTARSDAVRYNFDTLNFNGTAKVVGVDDDNYAFTYDGSTYALLNGSAGSGAGTAPANPAHVAVHRGRVFFSGMSADTAEIAYTAILSENDFSAASGGGSLQVPDTIVQLKSFREKLIIFCENSIYQLLGSSPSDFVLSPITRDLGCVDGFSVQEFGSNLVFLAPDGLRTVAATERIGDIELGSLSRNIQTKLEGVAEGATISSVVVKEKNQYRLFFPGTSATEANSEGIIMTQTKDGLSFSTIKGFGPACCTSTVISGDEYVLHGQRSGGYIYRQDQGNTFAEDIDGSSGTSMTAVYQSPDMILGDAGIRKIMQRVILNYEAEGVLDADLYMLYDYEDPDSAQPSATQLTDIGDVAVYGTAKYGTGVYGTTRGMPLIRQHVVGSGFAVGIKIQDEDGKSPFIIKGFQLGFTPGGRR